MPRWRPHDDSLQSRAAGFVQVEQALQEDRAHLDREFVRQREEVTREQMRRRRRCDGLEAKVRRERVRIERPEWRMRKDELVEGQARHRELGDRYAILGQRRECALNGLERGRKMETGQTVHGVEHDVRRL